MRNTLLFLFTVLSISASAQWNITTVVSGLPYPICVKEAPDGRFFITQKGGGWTGSPANAKVQVFQPNGTFQNTLWDFTDSVEIYFERGVLGVELDPNFNSNHYVYVFYNHDVPAQIRVVRFTELNGVGSNPTVLFQVNDPFAAGNHTGGNLHFRPGDTTHLYISIGDRATSSNSQLLTNWAGKILRIKKDGSIPTDNPFYDDGDPSTGNDDRIWCYGLRNTFDFTFSAVNDSLYGSENGLNTYDEVNQIIRGANYGWPSCEGITGACSTPGFTAPIEVWPSPLPAVTGILIYSDTLIPNMYGHMLVVDYNNGLMHDLTLGNAPAYNTLVNRTTVSGINMNSLIDLIQGQDGCLYVIDGGYTTNGSLKRICPQLPGFAEYEKAELHVYPNPVTDQLKLQLPNGVSTYEIWNTAGQRVQHGTVGSSIQVSELATGTYQIRVAQGNKTYSATFQKL